jgi:predicted AAA+ superfamily ATPase
MIKRKQIEVIVGSRRVGKTTLIKQIVQRLLEQGISGKEIFYLALDIPSLSVTPLSEHLKGMRRIFMHEREKKIFLFLDEVHEGPNWEAELKAVYDMENVKVFCTGSTSALITSQGSKLTGRQILTTVYPLSFREFLLFLGEQPSMSEDYKYEKLLDDYLEKGGYPEHVLNPSVEYLASLLDDILVRDLMRLHPIRKNFALKDLMRLIASGVGSRTSYNKLAKALALSVDTVKEYVGYLETAFLLKSVEKWTTSHTERVYAQKKIYFSDTGLKTLLTGPADLGAKAENAVFMELGRNNLTPGYFAESEREVDFVLGTAKKPLPTEVKFISSLDWTERRFSGIKLFLRRYPETKEVLLITRDVDKEFEHGPAVIRAVPLWRFLLSPTTYLAPVKG